MTTRAARRHALLVALAVCAARSLAAQNAEASRLGATSRPQRDSAVINYFAPGNATPGMWSALDRMPLWSAPLASAVVPGLGQARLHKDRFVAYLAVEAFLVLQYAKSSNDGRDGVQSYREIARDVARRSFPGTHPDTSAWKYYETMEKWLESGSFTLSNSGPTVPETDATTYNGSQWVEARRLFGVSLDDPGATQDPNYARALARYESTAVRQAYGWSWRDAQLEQDLYRRSIQSTNEAYRRATGDLIAIIANHVISAVDAFSSVRLTQAAGGEMRLSASIPMR